MQQLLHRSGNALGVGGGNALEVQAQRGGIYPASTFQRIKRWLQPVASLFKFGRCEIASFETDGHAAQFWP
jgi:hypothetical protein